MSEADPSPRDSYHPALWQHDAPLAVVIALNGDHRRNILQVAQDGGIGDVSGVKDEINPRKALKNARGEHRETFTNVAVGDYADSGRSKGRRHEVATLPGV